MLRRSALDVLAAVAILVGACTPTPTMAARDGAPVVIPPVPDAGEPPFVACGAAASGPDAAATDADPDVAVSPVGDAAAPDDAGECAPPPSECADRTWILYYMNGRCENGRCVWERQLFQCPSELEICVGGGCLRGST